MYKISNKILVALSLGLALSACSSGPSDGDTAVTGVAYIGATVSNLDRTSALYMGAANVQDVQSLDLTNEKVIGNLTGESGVTVSSRMLRSVNAQIRYMQFSETSEQGQKLTAVPVQGPGIAHLCFQVNAKTNTYEKFLEQGATHIGTREMQIVNSRNPVEYAYVHDHDNLIVEVEHVDVEKLNLDTPPKNEYRIRHISLATPDMDRAVKFYSEFLGEKKPRRIGKLKAFGSEAMEGVSGLPGSKIQMSWFQTRNLELELIQYESHPTETPATPRPLDALGYNMIVFEVNDMAKAKEQFVSAGGTIVAEPETMDGAQIMFGRDLDGNLIGMQISKAGSIVSADQFKDNGI